jgi:hypothetical protein
VAILEGRIVEIGVVAGHSINMSWPVISTVERLKDRTDTLQARVKELEKESDPIAVAIIAALEDRSKKAESRVKVFEVELNGTIERSKMLLDAKNHWMDRALRAEQERDEAYERLKPFAKAGELFQPRAPGDYDQCIYAPAAGPEYNLTGDHLRAARDLVRRLAGPEKDRTP